MKKVLIITYYWPPAGGIAVQRVLKFAKYLREFNWEPVIYTVANGDYPETDQSLLADVPSQLEVIKTKIWEPYNWYRLLTGKGKNQKIIRTDLDTSKNQSFTQKLSFWIRGNFFIPDTRSFWVQPSARYLKKYLTQHPVDAIISTGPPHSVHLIGLKVAAATGVPWIADFRDPWTTMDYYKDLKLTKRADKKHHKLERKVLMDANAVVVIGHQMKLEFEPKRGKSVEVISNGFDPDDFQVTKPIALDKEFTLAHAGSFFYRRNPEALWKAIAQLKSEQSEVLNDLKIKLIGRIDPAIWNSINEFKINEYVHHTPYIPYKEVPGQLMSSQILLLPIDRFEGSKWVITGKMFEYLAAKRPVLCIGPTDGDAAQIMNETNAGKAFDFDDVPGIYNYLKSQHHIYKQGKLYLPETNQADKYSRKSLTAQLAKLLNEISA